MRALFLADAHLNNPDDPNYQYLLSFLEGQLGRVDTLVLLGDIFEFWVGYRHTVFAAYIPILELLDRYRRKGTQLVFVEGNHDFHLGAYFRDHLGARVLPEGGGIELNGQKVFLAHGDLANPEDRGYRVLRRILRSLPVRLLIRILPPDLVWDIAARASRQSKLSRHKKDRRGPIREILLKYALAIKSRGYRVIVTGHFHQPFHEIMDDHELVALGDWINQFSYAVCEDGRFELKVYSPPSPA
jgi:UDP-2,3-diacylglucosamine hydrolase